MKLSMSQLPILVTGATGFLGRHILEQLDGKNKTVALMRSTKGWSEQNWSSNLRTVTPIEGGLDGMGTWTHRPEIEKLSGILHLAALVKHTRHAPEEVYRTNVQGTLNMVKLAAKKNCRMVYVSTSGTVGCFDNPHQRANEETAYCEHKVADWPYYHSKIIAEKKAIALAKKLGVELVIIRPPMMLGPGDHRFRSTSTMIRMMRGLLPFLIKGGMHYVDIRDAAAAMIEALVIEKPKSSYNLPGTMCSVDEFFEEVGKVSSTAVPSHHLPMPAAWALCEGINRVASTIKGEHTSLLPDAVVIEMGSAYWGLSSLYAADDLDFHPRSGEETIRDTVKWLVAEHPKLQQRLS